MPGDDTYEFLIVGSGASVPADGTVASGESSVNEAMITGESRPVDKDAEIHPLVRWQYVATYEFVCGADDATIDAYVVRSFDYVAYLSPSLAGMSSAFGANISRVNTIIKAPRQASVRVGLCACWLTRADFAAPSAPPSRPATTSPRRRGPSRPSVPSLLRASPADPLRGFPPSSISRRRCSSEGNTE